VYLSFSASGIPVTGLMISTCCAGQEANVGVIARAVAPAARLMTVPQSR